MKIPSISNKQKIMIGIYTLLAIVFAIFVFNRFDLATIKVYPDTYAYREVANFSIFSKEFWASGKAPIYPLLLHLLQSAEQVATVEEGSKTVNIIYFHFFVFIFSWLFFAVTVARQMGTILTKIIAFIFILLLSMTRLIEIWNWILLTESIQISFFVLLIGLWILYLEKQTRVRLFAIGFFLLPFSLIRDSNAYLLLMISAFIILWGIYHFVQTRKIHPQLLILTVLHIVAFFVTDVSANTGERWHMPFYNTITYRMLKMEEMEAYFMEHDFPMSDEIRARANKAAWDDRSIIMNGEAFVPLKEWMIEQGKGVYTSYLIKHPEYTLTKPAPQLGDVLQTPYSTYNPYVPQGYESSLPAPEWTAYIRQKQTLFFIGFLAGLLTALGLIKQVQKKPILYVIALVFMLTAYPHYLITWHADPTDLYRHSMMVSIQFRVAMLLLGIVALDLLVSAVTEKLSARFRGA